jgi:outer membrane protein assembly factor BamB
LLCADGRIYIFSEDGQTTVVQPGDRFELLARNTLDGSIMATPAVVGSAIFVRTDSHLYRIESTPARTAELRDAVPGT